MSDSLRPNIVLTGPAGSGKSTIGRRIATLGSREFVDIGAELTAAHGNVHELTDGHRRELERQLIADHAPKRNLVIATTPQTLLDNENLVSLLSTEVFHLTASTEELATRVTADGLSMRPDLGNAEGLADTIDHLRVEQSDVFDKFPTVDTTELSVEQTIDALRSAGADIKDPTAVVEDELLSGDGVDPTTRVFYIVIAAFLAIAFVLFVLVLTF